MFVPLLLTLALAGSPVVFSLLAPYPSPTISGLELQQLLRLYNTTGGVNWVDNTCWADMSGRCDPCTWFGVTCRQFREGPHVIFLELPHNGLTGSLPDTLGWLQYLKRLDLSHNSMHCELSSRVGWFKEVEHLDLSYNAFVGTIPQEIGNATKLRELYLNNNQLEGSLPATLAKLPHLELFNVSNNHLIGDIPSATTVTAWSHIRRVSFEGNDFNGIVPPPSMHTDLPRDQHEPSILSSIDEL